MATDETQRSTEPDASGDGAGAEGSTPMERSHVPIDPYPTQQTGRFQTGDVVHMAVVEGGMRIKRVFRVASGRRHETAGWCEYQLLDDSGQAYQGGQWFREKHLKAESSGAGGL